MNENISQTLIDFFRNYTSFEVHIRHQIIDFLGISTEEKYTKAPRLIKELVKPHNKDRLVKHIAELYVVEDATMCLTEKRDHVIHALNTFLLGLYLNDKFLPVKIDLFQWKLSALFHDIAYPLEISQKIIGRYFDTVKSISDKTHIENVQPNLCLTPKNFDKLTDNVSAFDLIQKRVSEWGLDVDIKKRYDEMAKDNKLCHGILGSLTVLYLIDLMYQQNNPSRKKEYVEHNGSNWNQENFEKSIVSACSAIYLHNLDPNDFFKKIDRIQAPLPYLLKLCDELQTWDRPRMDMPNGDSSENYAIDITQV